MVVDHVSAALDGSTMDEGSDPNGDESEKFDEEMSDDDGPNDLMTLD